MTGIALQVCCQMARALTLRLNVIVTERTTAASFCVIEVHRRLPGKWRMAAIAAVRGRNVANRFRSRPDYGTDTMTGRAIVRRAFEHCIDMTGFARQVTMLTNQFKASRQVIKFGPLRRMNAKRSNKRQNEN